MTMKIKLIAGVAAVAMLSTGALAQTAVIELAPEDRTVVYSTIIASPPPPPAATFSLEVGATVPAEVELYEVPATIEVEPVRTYRYVVVEQQVVLVDPGTREIVAIIAD
jgi:hypothetical protein